MDTNLYTDDLNYNIYLLLIPLIKYMIFGQKIDHLKHLEEMVI
jgi:hypothetical protein